MNMEFVVCSIIGGLVVLGIELAVYEVARLLKKHRQRLIPAHGRDWGARLEKGERGGGGRVPRLPTTQIDKGFPPSGMHIPSDYVCRKCRKSLCHDKAYCPLFPDVKPPPTQFGRPGRKWDRCVCFVHTCYDLDELISEYAAQGGFDNAEDELTFT